MNVAPFAFARKNQLVYLVDTRFVVTHVRKIRGRKIVVYTDHAFNQLFLKLLN